MNFHDYTVCEVSIIKCKPQDFSSLCTSNKSFHFEPNPNFLGETLAAALFTTFIQTEAQTWICRRTFPAVD